MTYEVSKEVAKTKSKVLEAIERAYTSRGSPRLGIAATSASIPR
jgi:hypothetical protein